MKTKRYANVVSPIEMQDLDLKIIKRVDGDTLIPEQSNLIHNIIEGDTLEITFSKNQSGRFWQVVNKKQLTKSKIFKMSREPIITPIKPLISSLDISNSQTDQAYIKEKQSNSNVLPVDSLEQSHQQQQQQLSISAQNGQLYQLQPIDQGTIAQQTTSAQIPQGVPPVQQIAPTQQIGTTQQQQGGMTVPQQQGFPSQFTNSTQQGTFPTQQGIPTQNDILSPTQQQVPPSTLPPTMIPQVNSTTTIPQQITPTTIPLQVPSTTIPQQPTQLTQQMEQQNIPNIYAQISPRLNQMSKKFQKQSRIMKYRPFHKKKKFRFGHMNRKHKNKPFHFRFIKTKQTQEYITYVFKPQFQELGGVKTEDYTTKIIFGKFEKDFCDLLDPVISVDVQVKYHKQHFT